MTIDKDTKKLSGELAGFTRATKTTKHRAIISVQGKEKVGKTNFGLTGPGPIAVQNVDIGIEGVVDKFAESKMIFVNDYRFDSRAAEGLDWKDLWKRVKDDFYAALESGSFRTIMIDTWSEMYEVARMGILGKLTNVLPRDYGKVYAQMREMIRTAFSHDTNVILLNKVKPEYVADKSTGRLVRAGFKDTGVLAQANFLIDRDPAGIDEKGEGGWRIKCLDCRPNASMANRMYEDMYASFPYIAKDMFPDSKMEDWT